MGLTVSPEVSSSTTDIVYYTLIIFSIVIGLIMSIILTIFFIRKKSGYSRILSFISLSECIFSYASVWFLFNLSSYEFIRNAIQKTFITNFFSDPIPVLEKISMNLFYSFQTFSILLNSCICLEMIFLLKYPVSKMQKRVKIYLISTSCIIILQSFLLIFNTDIDTSVIKNDMTLREKYFNLQVGPVLRIIIILSYTFFNIVGLLSIIYLVSRFCCKTNNIAKDLRNNFVFRHCFMVIVYSLLYLPIQVNTILLLSGRDCSELIYPEIAIIIKSLVPFVMGMVRASEANFFKNLKCRKAKRKIGVNETFLSSSVAEESADPNNSTKRLSDGSTNISPSNRESNSEIFFDPSQPMTSAIFKSLNFEFMCCILFGLREISSKDNRRTNRKTFKNDQEKDIEQGIDEQFANNTKHTNSTMLQNSPISKTLDGNDINFHPIEFKRAKRHNVFYKKFSNENEIENLSLKLETEKKNSENKNFVPTETMSNTQSANDLESDINSEKVSRDATIVEYCPRIFRELRTNDGITNDVLANALDPFLNKGHIQNIKESEGKSGSFFFFTHDREFIIKTITEGELNTLLGSFVKSYYYHVTENKNSLLTRIYGVYEVIIHGVSKMSIIFMQNLQKFPEKQIKRIFDLKGSRVQRSTKNYQMVSTLVALKDLDFLLIKNNLDENLFVLPSKDRDEILSVLKSDVKMLKEDNLMDYSLLLIIINIPEYSHDDYDAILSLTKSTRMQCRTFKSKNKKFFFCLGIIDYLQAFNNSKFWENKYKSLLYGKEKKFVSAVDPLMYSDRMLNFIRDIMN